MSLIVRNGTDMETSPFYRSSGNRRDSARGRFRNSRGGLKNSSARASNFSWSLRRPTKKGMILQRCQFFERLMAGADSEEPTGTATTNHACSMYKLSQDDDVTSQTSSANSVNASDTSYTNDGDCDTGGTSDALTVNSTEPSEDYSTDPSEENSRKDYGFYNIFPGLPDDDIESVPTPSKKLENDSVNKSVEVLRCDLNNEIDRMLSAAGTIEDASLSDSDDKGAIVNKDSEKEALSLEKVQENRRSCILR